MKDKRRKYRPRCAPTLRHFLTVSEYRAKRRPRHARRKYGRRFGPELSILNRPDVVAERRDFGHCECDLIQFRKKYGNDLARV